MKKLLVIFLLLIYSSATMGATVHLHYCMGELVGKSLWHSVKDKKCGKCGMKEKKGGCCKDEHKQLKLSTDQNHNQLIAFVFEKLFSPIILIYQPVYNFTQPATVAVIFPKNNAPPNQWQSVPLYLSNCVFLI